MRASSLYGIGSGGHDALPMYYYLITLLPHVGNISDESFLIKENSMGCLWWYIKIKLMGLALLIVLYLVAGAFVYIVTLVNEVIKFW